MRFVAHSSTVISIAAGFGWRPGARYTNLRDIRHVESVGFLDIDWKQYDFGRHLAVVKRLTPCVTVARDILHPRELRMVLSEAQALAQHACHVVVVPKAPSLGPDLMRKIPASFLLGYSVPTAYGGTSIAPEYFRRPVHLLGGRPDVQRALADRMPVVSIDCNRFTLDAAFGDYFDGERFRPHPRGGYLRCLRDSLRNINELWRDYTPPMRFIGCRGRCGMEAQ
jgi:hypothetical protein